MAGLCHQRDGNAAPHGSSADLCPAPCTVHAGRHCRRTDGTAPALPSSAPNSAEPDVHHNVELARCYLRLTNLPNFALDRLSRYEATLWRQLRQTLLSLDALDRRKPQERGRRFPIGRRSALPSFGDDESYAALRHETDS